MGLLLDSKWTTGLTVCTHLRSEEIKPNDANLNKTFIRFPGDGLSF